MTVMTLLTSRAKPEEFREFSNEPEILRDLDRLETIPVMSDSAVRAMALMNDPMAKISSIADLVRRDTILAAATLKLANTWAFRGKKAIEDVHQAVMRLGLRECGKIITAVGMKNLYSKHDPIVLRQCDSLVQHSFFTACVATGLNRLLQLGFGGEEFTAGLLHDIGRVVLCVKVPIRFLRAEMLDFSEDQDFLAKEREHYKTDHCAIGAVFASKNNLPPAVSEVVSFHHEIGKAREHTNLVALIAMADRLANHAQREHRITDYKLEECPGYQHLAATWDARKKGECKAILSPLVVKAMKETRSIVKSTSGV